jgi:uncharacterized hydrophobic protein (TIGR00271 family)
MLISNNTLQSRLQGLSQPSADFFFLLATATITASLGLLLNNQAVVIGAMIIAPMMGPLMSFSYGGLVGDRVLWWRSLFTIIEGSLIAVLIAYCVALSLQSAELTQEILARTQPTWLDLGIAIFAGAVGAYCQTKKNIGDTLAGVSIAVALVPPLAVIGIGLAHHSLAVSGGAALLYLINLVGITMSSTLVFCIMRFATMRQVGSAQPFDTQMNTPGSYDKEPGVIFCFASFDSKP